MKPDQDTLLRYRHTGTKGTPIVMHRSLRRMTLSRRASASIVLLPLFFCSLLWTYAPLVTDLWAGMFDFWIGRLDLDGQLSYKTVEWLSQPLAMPFPDLILTLPSQQALWINLAVSILALALADFIPVRYMPVTYALRATLLIQATATLYFILRPYSAPRDPAQYLADMLTLGMYLLFLVPLLLAMIYYIFDVPLRHKCAATFVIMAWFIAALPFQYLLHAMILHTSLLFMPVLYLLFGALFDTLMFVSWYAWVMTWKNNFPS